MSLFFFSYFPHTVALFINAASGWDFLVVSAIRLPLPLEFLPLLGGISGGGIKMRPCGSLGAESFPHTVSSRCSVLLGMQPSCAINSISAFLFLRYGVALRDGLIGCVFFRFTYNMMRFLLSLWFRISTCQYWSGLALYRYRSICRASGSVSPLFKVGADSHVTDSGVSFPLSKSISFTAAEIGGGGGLFGTPPFELGGFLADTEDFLVLFRLCA